MKRYLLLSVLVVFLLGVVIARLGVFESVGRVSEREFLINIHNECSKSDARRNYINCITATSKDYVATYGVAKLVEAGMVINAEKSVDLVGSINCHDLMHGLGKAAGLYMPSLSEAITECKPVCGGGCFHGVLEGRYSDSADLKKFVAEACLFTREDKKSEAHCYHGLGHAVAVQLGDIQQSFEYCDYASEEGRLGCGSGAFMELYSGDGFDFGQIPLDVPKWCGEFRGVYAEICWLSAGYYRVENTYLESVGVDVKKAENEAVYNCSKAPTEDLITGCVYTFGDNIYNIVNENLVKINEICQRFDRGLVEWCLRGAAHSAKRNHPTELKHIELCEINKDPSIVDECKSEF